MLLKNRFYLPPLRENSVERHQLITKLNSTAGGQLVLISAPAGYGKTTTVSQWLHRHPHSFAWLSIDKMQSSPDVLWEYIINALQTTQPSLGINATSLLKSNTHSSFEPVIISLLNDLDDLCTNNATKDPITLILDDFHHVENAATLQLMNLFLDHLPPSIRIVLTSRKQPCLAIARRRANNQIIEFTETDLAFHLTEGRDFFNHTMGLSLSDEAINTLCQQNEGWAVGLQLAALSLQQSLLSLNALLDRQTINRHISDYLFDEVFSQQSKPLQDFLIMTSSTSRFCAGLCNALMPKNDNLTLIKQLDKLNLFLVPLDNHRTWFRYHDLFRQFLLQHFNELDKKNRKLNYLTSSAWFEDAGYLDEALDQFILLQDWDNAARLLEQIASEKLTQGHSDSLLKWITQIPSEYTSTISLPISLSIPPATLSKQEVPSEPQTKQEPVETQLTEPLTRRESQVMALVSQGLPNKLIANELNISLNTLKVHIRNLYGKMGVENRSQALVKINTSSSKSN